MAHLTSGSADEEARTTARLKEFEREIATLAQHFLAGTVSDTVAAMLMDRKKAKAELIARSCQPVVETSLLPHPPLQRRYGEKIRDLRAALADPDARSEAAEAIRALISRIAVTPDGGGVSIAVQASTPTLLEFAETTNAPSRRGRRRSEDVVGGLDMARNSKRRPQAPIVCLGWLRGPDLTTAELGSAFPS